MKIRIQGNSIRIRLSKPEVEKLENEGYLAEKTTFTNSAFTYELVKSSATDTLTASFGGGKITMEVPAHYTQDWAANHVVGFNAKMLVGEYETLSLLLEKDFKCLDNATEDQSDNYENPNKSC